MRNSEIFKAKNDHNSRNFLNEGGISTAGRASQSNRRFRLAAIAGTLALCAVMVLGSIAPAFADDTTNTVPTGEYDNDPSVYSHLQGKEKNTMYGPGYGPYNVSGVVQSRSADSVTTFASGLPLSTIFIDSAKVGGPNAIPSKFELKATDKSFASGIKYIQQNGQWKVVYNPFDSSGNPMDGLTKIEPNKEIKFYDPNGLFTLTFDDAAILPNGDKANLQITYNNLKIIADERLAYVTKKYYNGAVNITVGSSFSQGGTDQRSLDDSTTGLSALQSTATSFGYTYKKYDAKYPTLGKSIDATFKIVNDNGVPIDGSFIFAMAGINLDRDPDKGSANKAGMPLWYINKTDAWKKYSFFSEAVEIKKDGVVSDNIFVRPNTSVEEDIDKKGSSHDINWFYPAVTKTSDGNIKFISNMVGEGANNSSNNYAYASGFVTVVDAAKGFTITQTGHGRSGDTMETQIFSSSQIWYRYTASTGSHGKIQTTTEGNWGGKLNDGGDILEPAGKWNKGTTWNGSGTPGIGEASTSVVTEGKTVTYTMTPDIGYKIGKLWIGSEWDSDQTVKKYTEIKFNNDDIAKMKKGDSITIKTADYSKWSGEKGEAILKYEENGIYTLKINHASANEAVHVEWEPDTADILTYKIWDDDDDIDGLRFAADKAVKLPQFKLQWSLNGKTWQDVDKTMNIGLKEPYKLKSTVKEQTVPAGKDQSGAYKDGTYEINNDTTGDHPFTWEHLPVYSYDSNGVADKQIQYRLVELDDPWHEEYHKAEYYDHQSFDLLSTKENSTDGWAMYSDGTTTYVKKGDGKYYGVDKNGASEKTPASQQPDESKLTPVSSSEYWTVDKGVKYYEVQAKNTHFVTKLFVDVSKKWDDASLLGLSAKSGNEYAREDIKIVLHGEIEADSFLGGKTEPVDLNGHSAGTDLELTINKNETDSKKNATARLDYYPLYSDGTVTYALLENVQAYKDGYYKVNGDAIDYTAGPVDVSGKTLNRVTAGDGSYKINNNEFGVTFDELPTHYQGKEIKYTVKELDNNGNELDKWIMTGGVLSNVQNKNLDTIGYNTQIVNTPDVEEVYTKLPITIHKRDVNTGAALADAEFTVYTNAVTEKKAVEPDDELVGAKQLYSKTEDGVKTRYVLQKDSSDSKLKYYEVDENGTIADDPADPQPSKVDLTKDGLLGGETAWTDGTNKYVKRGDSYYKVNSDGGIDTDPSTPDLNLIRKVSNESTGEVTKNTVTTDSKGNATFHFLKSGTYYIKETAAPSGYTADATIYVFDVDAELNKISLKAADDGHATKWWEKLFDLFFGDDTKKAENWVQDEYKKGGTLKVDDSPITANVLVRKYWEDKDNQDNKRPGDKNDPTSTADTNLPIVTLQYTTSAHTAEGLYVYKDAAGNKYVHKVADNQYYKVTKEDTIGTYDSSAASTQPSKPEKVSGSTCAGLAVYKEDETNYVLIDGAYHEVMTLDETGSVEASPAGTQPDAAKLELVKDGDWITAKVDEKGVWSKGGSDAKTKTNYVGGPVLTDQYNAYTWNAMPAYMNGKLMTYRIWETGTVLDDKTYVIKSNQTSQTKENTFNLAVTDGDKPESVNQTVDVTNEHVPQVINIEAYKTWDDTDVTFRKKSTVRLYKIVNGVESVVTKGSGASIEDDTGTVPVVATEDAIKVWNDLPAYEGGYPVTYEIREDAIEGYITSYKHEYTKTDGGAEDDAGASIIAENVQRTYYTQDDAAAGKIPDGKKVGDEKTTAKLRVTNERSTNVAVTKKWLNGANANVTFELWRTTTAEADLTDSKLSGTNIDADDSSVYYRNKTDGTVITKADYEALEEAAKADYQIEQETSWSPYAGGGKEASTYVLISDGTTEISKAEYDALTAAKKKLYKAKTVDGWEFVDSHVFEAGNFEVSATGSVLHHSFNDLALKDANGKTYLYRVLETPGLVRFRENQIDNTTVIDNNVNASDGNATLEVVKELEGRPWNDDDRFYFQVEAVNGKDITNLADETTISKDKVPIPWRTPRGGSTEYDYTADATKSDEQVGALGRAVRFLDIQYKEDSDKFQDIERGHTYEFFYKVSEIYDIKTEGNITDVKTTLDDATKHTGKLKGITYDGEVKGKLLGKKFEPTVHEAKVVVKSDQQGHITTELFWKNAEGNYVTGAVPVYTNRYSSEGTAKIWLEKKIANRKWNQYISDQKTGDAFSYTIESISGAEMNVPGSTRDDSYTTKPLMSNTEHNPNEQDIQQLSDTEYAFGVSGNVYKNTMLNSEGYAYFIYEISEDGAVEKYDDHYVLNNYTVDGLDYDKNKIYLRVKAQDNWDGTIGFTMEYFKDASCKDKITNHKVWIFDGGAASTEAAHLLTKEAAADAEKMTEAERKENKYSQVDVAYFTNYDTLDIPVRKEWTDGPAIEDVTLRLQRHLFPLNEESSLNYDYVKEKEAEWDAAAKDSSFWKDAGYTHIAKRGEFLKDDGTPDYDAGSKTTSSETYKNIEGFNKDLPKYVTVDGVVYRAVYKLVEDNTSDAYKTGYSVEYGKEKKEDAIFVDSGTLVVTNKVVAANTANIAAVKQLRGRQWLAADEFKFELTPIGKGKYDEKGKLKEDIDDSDAAKKSVPMPEKDTDKKSETTDAGTVNAKSTTTAWDDANDRENSIVVDNDKGGNLERLARFGAINFKVSDLHYDKDQEHRYGDFFYLMKEKVPEVATRNKDGTYTKDGITYSKKESRVHVHVEEDRTGTLRVQIAYDENPQGKIGTGTQFTPVFTNTYDAETVVDVDINKHIMGRNWKEGETFDFIMYPMAGAPFEDADKSEFPDDESALDEDGKKGALAKGKSVHDKDGAHVKRMFIQVDATEVQSFTFPKLRITLPELSKVTTAEGEIKDAAGKIVQYEDGSVIPVGTAYGQFMYAVEETEEYKEVSDDLDIDPDTEYARVTVIDRGTGTMEYFVEIFEDRYAKNPRYTPNPDGTPSDKPAKAVTFVNQLNRDIKVSKAWAGTATSDVTLKLQWSTNKTNWHDVEGTDWFVNVDGTRIIKKNAAGDDLTIEWKDLPGYADISDDSDTNGSTGDDNDLNDKWIYYQVVEEAVDNVDTRYNAEEYQKGDKIDKKDSEGKNVYIAQNDSGYTGFDTGEVGNNINQLYVTNFPKEITANVSFGVVKQYIGKDWEAEEFTFKVEPVKSRTGDATDYTDYDATNNPMPHINVSTATAKKGQGTRVSVNEWPANFAGEDGAITIRRSDLALDNKEGSATKGMLTGEFIYRITEEIPYGAADSGAGYKEALDANGNRIKYTTAEHTVKIVAVDDGSSTIRTSVSYDEREGGQFVPVYTNYAMKPTPVYGTKTWTGGADDDHVNGTVELSADKTEIKASTDKLGLVLKRKADKKNAEYSKVEKDDAGRELVIVWVEETRKTEPVVIYVNKDDGSELSKEDYEKLPDEEKANYDEKTTYVTSIKYDPQVTGNGTFTVKALDDDGKYVDPVLDASDSDGNKYIYSVYEGKVPSGYEASVNGMDVTNTSTSGAVNVVVSKKWDDADDQDGKRPASVEVSISADGWNGRDVNNKKVGPLTLSDDNNWKSVFKDLPEKSKDGKKYDYVISESSVDGYVTKVLYQRGSDSSWKSQKPYDWNYKARVVNSRTPDVLRIEASKVWAGEDGMTEAEKKALHTDVILHLYGFRNGEVIYYAGSKEIKMKPDGTPEGKAVWTDVPKRYFNDSDLEWKIVEDPVFGYTSKVSDITKSSSDEKLYEATVTNTYSRPVTSVKVSKEWDDTLHFADEEYDYKKRPESVTFELYRKVGDTVEDEPYDTQVVKESDNWEYEWTGLPVTEEVPDGSEETSRVEYETQQKKDSDGKLVFKLKETGEEVSFTEEEYEALSVDEKAKYEAVTESVPTEKKETVSKTKELPVLYIVKEVYEDSELKSNHYLPPIVEAPAPGEFKITNALSKETVNIPVTKVWSDNGNTGGLRPEYITLSLKDENHDKVVRRVELSAENQKSETEKDSWVHTFMGLPKYDENGEDIVYKLYEKDIPAYDKSVSGSADEGFTVINTHNAGSKTSLTVTKKWEGDENDKSDRTSVDMQLIQVIEGARKEIGEPVTIEYDPDDPDAEMKYTWKDLDTIHHGKTGELEVTYTVTEKPVKGYTTSVSDVKYRFDEVTPKEDDSPKANGWYEKKDDEYVATADAAVEKDKIYYEKHFAVTVTNSKGELPLRGDVIYVDPKNPVGKNAMILKSTSYKNPEKAKAAAEKRSDAPSDPKHKGVKFVGWDLNWDDNGNYVLVATYSDIPTTVTPVTTYIDPQSGEPVLISEITNDPSSVKVPADPKHKNLQFVGWVRNVDAGGNTIFVAKFNADCANRANANANGNGKGVDTGESNELTLWIATMFAAAALLSIHLEMRRRERESRR